MKRLKNCLFIILSLCSSLAYAQRTVSGRVTNQGSGEALAGVSVTVKGSNTSTATSPEGNFSIAVPSSQFTLVFTSVGFTPQEFKVGNVNNFSIALSEAYNP